jgi:hypothetical protein
MAHATAPHFSVTCAIFEKFIALLGFHRRELQISKVAHEIMPGSGMGNHL